MKLRWIENHDVVEAFCYDASGRLWRVQVLPQYDPTAPPGFVWVAHLANCQDRVIRLADWNETSVGVAKWDAEQFLGLLGFKEKDE